MGRGLELTHHFSLMVTVPAAGLQTLGSGIREAAAREIKLASGTHTSRAVPGNSCLHAHGEEELVITLE